MIDPRIDVFFELLDGLLDGLTRRTNDGQFYGVRTGVHKSDPAVTQPT
jgi:hypothetical protein